MERMTITEALAEIKTIGKRIEKKKEVVNQYLVRPENMRDPLDKEGGSEARVREAIQSITDLFKRWVRLRLAIQIANANTELTIGGQTATIAEWLIWRREAAAGTQSLWEGMAKLVVAKSIYQFNTNMNTKETVGAIVAYPQADIIRQCENYAAILGDLDGQLSLKNATTFIEL